jgi:hypothetical protein
MNHSALGAIDPRVASGPLYTAMDDPLPPLPPLPPLDPEAAPPTGFPGKVPLGVGLTGLVVGGIGWSSGSMLTTLIGSGMVVFGALNYPWQELRRYTIPLPWDRLSGYRP